MRARTYLKNLYLEWFNDWLSINAFATYHGLSYEDARSMLAMGKIYHNEDAEQPKG